MNRKLPLLIITLCAIAILSFYPFSAMGETTNQFTATPTPIIFTPTTQFPIPATNGTISFAQIGFYENATLIDDAWVFSNLNLNSEQSSLLTDSPTTANLNITTQNSNITITRFERLLTPDTKDYQNTGSWLTPGWLNYTVSGVGEQTIRIQFNLANWTQPSPDSYKGTATWPMGVAVYIDEKPAEYDNFSWKSIDEVFPYGTGLIVNGANANVSIKYAWAPIPGVPVNQSPTDSNSQTASASLEETWLPYLLLVAMANGIIIPVAIFTNRHRLASLINRKKMMKSKKLAVLFSLFVISLVPIAIFFVVDYPRAEVFIRGLLTGQAGISVNVSKDWFDIYSTVFFGSIRFSLTYVVVLLSSIVGSIASLALIAKNLYSSHKLPKREIANKILLRHVKG
jgi:hypothetical protein